MRLARNVEWKKSTLIPGHNFGDTSFGYVVWIILVLQQRRVDNASETAREMACQGEIPTREDVMTMLQNLYTFIQFF